MLADIADRDGETHTAILERGDAKRARAEAETHLTRVGETGRLLEAAGEAAILDKGPQGMTCTRTSAWPSSIRTRSLSKPPSGGRSSRLQAEALEPALDAAVAAKRGTRSSGCSSTKSRPHMSTR